ncbi:hypothetical protein VD0004_g6024 [Verticillium dahliae]|nr:hypothetical protein VdG2_01683 [Verticillium dahliae VDG2]PNH41030.1 hypothetical protein VD0004_g6024 [Verticillium dahliae]PNH71659.1 hypothetical protein VD0001_g5876 [Verticillium dahliae]
MWSPSPVTVAGFTAPGHVALAAKVLTAVVFLLLFRRFMLPRPIPGIPYNKHSANRILGDVPDIISSGDRREWFVSQAIKHKSPMVQFFTSPFRPPAVFLFDHREAQNISVRRLKEFDRSLLTRDIFSIAVPHQMIALQSRNPQHKKNMSLVRELMTPTFLRQVSAPHIHEKILWLLDLWAQKAAVADGRLFNANTDVHHAALDMIMGASFGLEKHQSQLQVKLDSLQRETASLPAPRAAGGGDGDEVLEFDDPPMLRELQACKTIADSIGVNIKSILPVYNAWFYRNVVPSMRGALKTYRAMARREISKSLERLHAGHPDRSAMDQLLAREDVLAKKEGRKPDYYSEVIMDELLGYLIGGHETTSSVLQWGLKYTTADQRVQSKLRQTFYKQWPQAKAEGRLPTLEEMTDPTVYIPYLEAFMQESTRHAKALSIMSRQAQVPTTVLGVSIPAGTNVTFTNNGPGYFSAPIKVDEEKRHESSRAAKGKLGGEHDEKTITDFLPERWIKTKASFVDGREVVEETFDANAAPFLGFGDGPRMCFGKRLALLEMRLFWVMLLWRFELRPISEARNREHEEAVFLTRIPKHAYLRLKKIDYEKAGSDNPASTEASKFIRTNHRRGASITVKVDTTTDVPVARAETTSSARSAFAPPVAKRKAESSVDDRFNEGYRNVGGPESKRGGNRGRDPSEACAVSIASHISFEDA